MKTKTKVLLLVSIIMVSVVIFGFSANVLVRAESNYRNLSYPSDQFSISLPNNWIEISQEQFQSTYEVISRFAPNLKHEKYNYGFQLGTARTNYMQYPNIFNSNTKKR